MLTTDSRLSASIRRIRLRKLNRYNTCHRFIRKPTEFFVGLVMTTELLLRHSKFSSVGQSHTTMKPLALDLQSRRGEIWHSIILIKATRLEPFSADHISVERGAYKKSVSRSINHLLFSVGNMKCRGVNCTSDS